MYKHVLILNFYFHMNNVADFNEVKQEYLFLNSIQIQTKKKCKTEVRRRPSHKICAKGKFCCAQQSKKCGDTFPPRFFDCCAQQNFVFAQILWLGRRSTEFHTEILIYKFSPKFFPKMEFSWFFRAKKVSSLRFRVLRHRFRV